MIQKIVINKQITLDSSGSSDYSFYEVDGLTTPSYRNTNVVYAGRNGGQTSKQLYGQRVVSIKGGIDEFTCNDHLAARRALVNALSFDADVPIDFVMSNGQVFTINGKFDQPQMEVTGRVFSDFQLIIMSSDWRIYDTSGGASNSVTLQKVSEDGWQIASDGWFVDATGWWIYSGQSPTSVVNSGTTAVPPIFTINGASQNPTITNVGTGQSLKVNVTTSPGDVLVIDANTKSVVLNGGNINGLLDPGSSWFYIQPGSNMLSFNQVLTNSTAVTISWYNAYVSV